MIALLSDLALKATWWALYQTYCGLHYLYYGHQPTIEEKMNLKLDDIETKNNTLISKISGLENLIKNNKDNEQHRYVPTSRVRSNSI